MWCYHSFKRWKMGCNWNKAWKWKGIEEAAKNLIKLENELAEKFKKPSFKMILVANGMAYRRKDGIYVVPINLLKD